MQYPESLRLADLEATHDSYEALSQVWNTIDILATGGHLIEFAKEQFLPQRAAEPDFVYQQRIKKFTYRNLLGSAVQQQSSKLTAGSYSITGLESNQKFWQTFRENLDLKGTSEADFLPKLFRQALLQGTVYIHVDQPIVPVQPINKQQETLLGIRPYLVVYNACDVIDYDEDQFGKLTFIKVRQVTKYRPNPFSPPIDQVIWTWITSEVILKYSALVKFDRDGNILYLITPDGKEIPVSEDTTIPLTSPPIPNGLNRMPVVRFQLPSDLWIADQVYLKCLEHLNLDNIKYDAASLATYIQRVYRPYTVTSDQIPDLPSEGPIMTGNPYVLQADHFEFSEMQGTALTVVSQILSDLEQEIRDSVSLGVASATKQSVEQSGVSKRLDLYREEIVLRSYGQLILNTYQDILQLVAQTAGIDGSGISMTGFDSFSLDNLSDLLLTAQELLQLRALLPPTTLNLFSKQLCSALTPNASAEEKAVINAEIDQINFKQVDQGQTNLQQADRNQSNLQQAA